jgi:Na+/phosphate symporter
VIGQGGVNQAAGETLKTVLARLVTNRYRSSYRGGICCSGLSSTASTVVILKPFNIIFTQVVATLHLDQ